MLSEKNPREVAEKVRNLAIMQAKLRENCINLIASENVSSPTVRELCACDFMHRYSEWEENNIEKRWGPGDGQGPIAQYIIKIEKEVVALAQRLFNVKYVEPRCLSGQVAIMSVVTALVQQGEGVFEVSEEHGGHGWGIYPPPKYKMFNFVFDPKEWNIDVDESAKIIRREKPRLLITGSSFYLFPQPVRELSDLAREVGANIVSDEAHVFGLIAGKQWPNPLDNGSEVMTGSTHKTFFGPQKGMALTNDEEIITKIGLHLYPGYLTNHHLHHSAGLAIALAEMSEFGEAYAKQVVTNAKALAETLAEKGFSVMGEGDGYTQCHTVLVDTSKYMPGTEAGAALERVNIVVNGVKLQHLDGLRIGVAEPTRLRMKESEMKWIADMMAKAIIQRKDPEVLKSEVIEITRDFRYLHYSFNDGFEAYRYYKFC